jgi:hypothetical protein
MPRHRMRIACSTLVLVATAASPTLAEQRGAVAGMNDPLCGNDQPTGQYECVRSVPLSDEEVRVNMTYLASLRSLYIPEGGVRAVAIAAVRVSPQYTRLINRESYRAEACSGDYVCDEDGPWTARP